MWLLKKKNGEFDVWEKALDKKDLPSELQDYEEYFEVKQSYVKKITLEPKTSEEIRSIREKKTKAESQNNEQVEAKPKKRRKSNVDK